VLARLKSFKDVLTKPPRHGVTKEHEKAGKDLGVDWKKGSHILFDKVAQRVPPARV